MTDLDYPCCPECNKTLKEVKAPDDLVFLCCSKCGRMYDSKIIITKYKGRVDPSYLG
jgi:transcription elongation factor Elf1